MFSKRHLVSVVVSRNYTNDFTFNISSTIVSLVEHSLETLVFQKWKQKLHSNELQSVTNICHRVCALGETGKTLRGAISQFDHNRLKQSRRPVGDPQVGDNKQNSSLRGQCGGIPLSQSGKKLTHLFVSKSQVK